MCVYFIYHLGVFFFFPLPSSYFSERKKGPFPFGLQNAWENFRKTRSRGMAWRKMRELEKKKKLSYALCHVHIKGTWMFFHYISCELLHTHVQMKKCYFSILRVQFSSYSFLQIGNEFFIFVVHLYTHKMLDLRERYLCVYDRSLNFFNEDGIYSFEYCPFIMYRTYKIWTLQLKNSIMCFTNESYF